MRFQPWHMLVLVVVVLVVFGANRLPDVARSVGQSLKVFRSEVKDLVDDEQAATPKDDVDGARPGA